MYNNSFIVNFIFILLQKLYNFYRSSVTAFIIGKVADKLKKLFENSGIWNFIKRNDFLTAICGHSRIVRFFDLIINTPLHWLGRMLGVCREKLSESYFVRLANNSSFFGLLYSILARNEALIGISVLLISVVHHRYWNNLYSTIIVFALLLIFFLKIAINKLEDFSLKEVDPVLLIFISAVITALFTGLFPKQSLRFFIFYITCFAFVFIITLSIRTVKSLDTLVKIILSGIFVTAIYAIYQRIVGVPFDPTLTDITLNQGMPGRVFSTMQNPNNYAEVLVLTLPFFAAVILNSKTVFQRLLFAAFMFLSVVALLATGSRSSWIGLAVAGFVFVFFKERRLIPVMLVLGVMSLPVLKVAAPSVYLRAMTIFNAGSDTSFSYRGLIYDMFKPMLKDFWMTGIGLGTGIEKETFMKIFQRYPLNPKMYSYPPHTHNLFLQIWIEVGLIGIFTFIWFIVRIIKKAMINIFQGKNIEINHMLMAGVSAVCGSLVMGLAEYTWFYPRAMLFFWIDIGIIMACLAISSREGTCCYENSDS